MTIRVVKEVIVRKPILDETGRVGVRVGEGVDLFFGEVLAIPGVEKRFN